MFRLSFCIAFSHSGVAQSIDVEPLPWVHSEIIVIRENVAIQFEGDDSSVDVAIGDSFTVERKTDDKLWLAGHGGWINVGDALPVDELIGRFQKAKPDKPTWESLLIVGAAHGVKQEPHTRLNSIHNQSLSSQRRMLIHAAAE